MDFTRRSAAALLLGAGITAPRILRAQSHNETQVRDDLLRLFRQAESDGTIAVLELGRNRLTLVGAKRAAQPFPPASTFKILHSLIALETGVVEDADRPAFKWDGTKRSIADWNADQTLRSAFKLSTVWFYQEIARRIGTARMRAQVTRLGYGNGDIGGAPLDEFWLAGDLRISALEQIDFLARFVRGELPVRARSAAIAKEIMLAEEGEGYRIRAKTGLSLRTKPGVGWWVGWVERGGETSLFALNMDMTSMAENAKRQQVAKAILGELGML
jgi:beta-lactamase class D